MAIQEFFKVFLQQTSLSHLRLPNSFVRYFNGITPSTTNVVDEQGNTWQLGLQNLHHGLTFTTGWPQFVLGKALDDRDFLVFTYEGGLTFGVKVFGKDGCKKTAASTDVILLDHDSDTNTTHSPSTVNHKIHIRQNSARQPLYLPSRFVRHHLTRDMNSVTLNSSSSTVDCRLLWNTSNQNVCYIGKGWSQFMRDNHLVDGDEVIFSPTNHRGVFQLEINRVNDV